MERTALGELRSSRAWVPDRECSAGDAPSAESPGRRGGPMTRSVPACSALIASTISQKPLSSAISAAVRPVLVRSSAFAPARSSACTTSVRPRSAALCRAVQAVLAVAALMSTPSISSFSTMATSPRSAPSRSRNADAAIGCPVPQVSAAGQAVCRSAGANAPERGKGARRTSTKNAINR